MAVENLVIRMAVEGAAAAAGEAEATAAAFAEVDVTADRAGMSTRRLGGALGMLKMVAGTALVVGMGKALSSAAKFQRQMEMLQTQTGATHKEVENASKGILGMAVSVGTGPNSLAQAMYHIESAGYRGQTALNALRIAAEGAQVGNANLVDTTTALTAVMVAGYAKGKNVVDQLKSSMGALNATVGAGDMTIQDLNEALTTGLLASMKTLGVGIKDTGAALAVLGDNNIRGAVAATRLRMSLMQLVHLSGRAQTALAQVGIGPEKLAETLRKPDGLLKMLELLHKHLDGLSKTDQAQILASVFGGSRNSAAILTLYGQMDRLRTKYAQVTKGQDGFNQAWADTQKNLSFVGDQLKAFAEVVLIKVGFGLAKVVGWLEDLVRGFQQGKAWAVAIIAVLAGFGTFVAVFMAIRTATDLWRGAQELLNVTLLDNPIGMVIAAIAALVVAVIVLYNKWAWFRNAINAIWSWMKTAALDTGKWVVNAFNNVVQFLEGMPATVAHIGSTLWDGLKTGLVDVLNWIIEKFNAIPFIHGFHLGPIHMPGIPRIGLISTGGGGAPRGRVAASRTMTGPGIGHRALGGPINYSGNYTVGENGPETVYLPGGSYVEPRNENALAQVVAHAVAQAINGMGVFMDGRPVGLVLQRVGLMDKARGA